MELGEATEETARREVHEETGLTVGTLELIGVFSGKKYFIVAENGDEFYVVTIAYSTKDIQGTLKINDDESLAFRYYALDHLPTLVKTHAEIIDHYTLKKSAK